MKHFWIHIYRNFLLTLINIFLLTFCITFIIYEKKFYNQKTILRILDNNVGKQLFGETSTNSSKNEFS